MARRLVEAGVNLVQVNLGNNETWDTHGNMFPHLKEKLFPPTDQALSALLDDLHESGLLDSTLIVMAGEFGRTPRISSLPQSLQAPRPRSLGQGPDRLPRRRRSRRRPGRRLVRQDRRVPPFRPPDAREPGCHDLSCRSDCRRRSHGTMPKTGRITSIEEIQSRGCFESRYVRSILGLSAVPLARGPSRARR